MSRKTALIVVLVALSLFAIATIYFVYDSITRISNANHRIEEAKKKHP